MSERMSLDDVVDRLDRIIAILDGGQFQPMSETRPEPMPDIEQALRGARIDVSLLEIKDKSIKPTKWIGDDWTDINEVLKRHGYNWISAGENSRWELGAPPRSPPPQSGDRFQITDPDAPATDKQLALLQRMKVYIKPDLTKGEASKLIESKKNW